MSRVTWHGLLEIAIAFLITIACLWYVYLNPAYDVSTFLIGVALPAVSGSALLILGRQRSLLFVFLAYFWSLVDDAPVHFDSVLTWPEVTRYQPIVPYFMDFVLLTVVLSFFYLAVRECLRGRKTSPVEKTGIAFLTLVVFGLSYLQDVEIGVVHYLVSNFWYQLDLTEHIASGVVLYFTLRLALGIGPKGRVSATGSPQAAGTPPRGTSTSGQ